MKTEQRLPDESHRQLVAQSRETLLRAIGAPKDLTFVRLFGNIGDELIYAGTRALLANHSYREVSVFDLQDVRGHTALLAGSGGWCQTYHKAAEYLPVIEERFDRVIVLPSSFEPSEPVVQETLSNGKAIFFAREKTSHAAIANLCDARLACDCACFFDFDPYRREGEGCLTAYRTDRESSMQDVPMGNNDISRTCDSLDEWLWTIAKHSVVQTDRAHVAIAAALLGKHMEFQSSNYHKVPAIVGYCLPGFQVRQIESDQRQVPQVHSAAIETQTQQSLAHPSDRAWREERRILSREIMAAVPRGSRFILIGGEKVGWLPLLDRQAIPFLERDGKYWGHPADDSVAVGELERLRGDGVSYLVFPWTEFWWLDHYSGFRTHLMESFTTAQSNSHVLIFDLCSRHQRRGDS